MRRRTIDLLETTVFSSHFQGTSEGTPSDYVCRISVDTCRAGLQGWCRLKFISPEELLRRVAIESINKQGSTICAFETTAPSKHYAAYIFLGSPTTSVKFRLDFDAMPREKTLATLRPISLIEYVWHSLRRGFFVHPLTFLSYFFRPIDPFVLIFDFPRPPQRPQTPQRVQVPLPPPPDQPTQADQPPSGPRSADRGGLYEWWIAEREGPAYQRLSNTFSVQSFDRPPISILMTVCDPQPIYVRKAIDSVLRQTADNWQLCIADDASTNSEVRQILSDAAQSDRRITVDFRERRGGISAASNTALALATSPFCVGLDHDDMLAPSAIETFTSFLGAHPLTRLLYSDEDKINQLDKRFMPFFKPDFSRELLYSLNYINHLTAYHSDTIRTIGGWRSEFDGSQDYDMNLRTVEIIDDRQIGHIPMILYHWRAIPGSAALDIGFKRYAIEAGRRALSAHLGRRSIEARVEVAANALYRVRYEVSAPLPKVSIIIPFRDKATLLQRCVSSIQEKTTYRNYEIILVDNESTESSTLNLLKRYQEDDRFRVLRQPGAFNYSALNNRAVEFSDGEYLCLLNNDTEVITPDWLDDMVGYASQSGIGCVGAKLYYANGTIQHAGVLLGMGGVAGHVFLNKTRDDPGYFGRLLVASNYSAVTAACLLVKRSIYMEVGGFDETDLPVAFNDVDFCIKVRSRGYRNVMTPFAELFHYESSSRGMEDTPEKALRFQNDVRVMRERYGALLDTDPCYSPHLTLMNNDFSLRVD